MTEAAKVPTLRDTWVNVWQIAELEDKGYSVLFGRDKTGSERFYVIAKSKERTLKCYGYRASSALKKAYKEIFGTTRKLYR